MPTRYRLLLAAGDDGAARCAAVCLRGELLRAAREAKCLLLVIRSPLVGCVRTTALGASSTRADRFCARRLSLFHVKHLHRPCIRRPCSSSNSGANRRVKVLCVTVVAWEGHGVRTTRLEPTPERRSRISSTPVDRTRRRGLVPGLRSQSAPVLCGDPPVVVARALPRVIVRDDACRTRRHL